MPLAKNTLQHFGTSLFVFIFISTSVFFRQQMALTQEKSKGSVSIGSAVVKIDVEDTETGAVEHALGDAPLLYKVSDAPPIYLTILFGLQV